MLTLIFFFLVALIVCIPFVPGMIELIRKKDALPLPIDLEKSANPYAENCANTLTIDSSQSFQQLYAKKIITKGTPSQQEKPYSPIDIGQWGMYGNAKMFIIPPTSHLKHDIYIEQNIHIRDNAQIDGDIQTNGNITLGDHIIVTGNLFAKGNIVIGKNCQLHGHVFSQKSVTIHSGTVIGEEGKIKSIIGKKRIQLQDDVTIYGFVNTKGNGVVV